MRSVPLDGDAAVKARRDQSAEPRRHSWHGEFQALDGDGRGSAVVDREAVDDLRALRHSPKIIDSLR